MDQSYLGFMLLVLYALLIHQSSYTFSQIVHFVKEYKSMYLHKYPDTVSQTEKWFNDTAKPSKHYTRIGYMWEKLAFTIVDIMYLQQTHPHFGKLAFPQTGQQK